MDWNDPESQESSRMVDSYRGWGSITDVKDPSVQPELYLLPPPPPPPLKKMAAILQTTDSNAFSWMKMSLIRISRKCVT